MAILFLDLNRFKAVNDTLGHDVGDELLKRVTTRIRGLLRDSDVLGRLGGDPFKQFISNVVAQCVIHRLKSVEIEKQNGHLMS
ncbi:MAG: GGDEF domain-containing protein [Pseudomonadota bacterium]